MFPEFFARRVIPVGTVHDHDFVIADPADAAPAVATSIAAETDPARPGDPTLRGALTVRTLSIAAIQTTAVARDLDTTWQLFAGQVRAVVAMRPHVDLVVVPELLLAEIIADNLSKAGWTWGCVATFDSNGRTIFVADAHRDDGKRYVVHADEMLTAFVRTRIGDSIRQNATEIAEGVK